MASLLTHQPPPRSRTSNGCGPGVFEIATEALSVGGMSVYAELCGHPCEALKNPHGLQKGSYKGSSLVTQNG